MATETNAGVKAPFRTRRNTVLATLSAGHGLKHWYLASFWVILPLIKADMGLSNTSVGLLVGSRQMLGGIANFAIGPLSDALRSRWHLVLPGTFLSMAICYMLVGLAPAIIPMALFLGLGGVFANLWHPPALSILSQRFPDRKGIAMSFHGGGAGAGEALAPLGAGFILTFLAWRDYLTGGIIPGLVIALLLYWMLAGMGVSIADTVKRPPFRSGALQLLKDTTLVILALASGARALAHFALITFLAIYLREHVGMSIPAVGAHLSLLTLLGVGLGPMLGHASDRIGRKPILVLGLGSISAGAFLMGLADGWQLTLVIAFVGIFLFSVQDIVNAAALARPHPGQEGMVIGFVFGSNFIFSAFSPLIAGLLVDMTGQTVIAFYFAATTMAVSALLVLIAPLKPHTSMPAAAS